MDQLPQTEQTIEELYEQGISGEAFAPMRWDEVYEFLQKNNVYPSEQTPIGSTLHKGEMITTSEVVIFHGADGNNGLVFHRSTQSDMTGAMEILNLFIPEIGFVSSSVYKKLFLDAPGQVHLCNECLWDLPEGKDFTAPSNVAIRAQLYIQNFAHENMQWDYTTTGKRYPRVVSDKDNFYLPPSLNHVYDMNGTILIAPSGTDIPTLGYESPFIYTFKFMDAQRRVQISMAAKLAWYISAQDANFAKPTKRFIGVRDFAVVAVEPLK